MVSPYLIEQEFEKHIKTKSKTLKDSMLYSLNAGGKRIRPILFLEFFKLFDPDFKKALPFAVAIEMIHTYSLVHDDMPCMDNDDLRRGKPTNHKVYGEDIALLCGDSLLNTAYEIITEDSFIVDLKAEKVLKAVNVLAKCSGESGMIYGQALDIQNETKSLNELEEIHINKTAKLLMASCVTGAILSNGSAKDIENAENFAYNLGIAFQIKDDLLDKYGNTEEMGKEVNSDEKLGKKTYLAYKSKSECEELVEEYTKKALDSIKTYENKQKIEEIAISLIKRDK